MFLTPQKRHSVCVEKDPFLVPTRRRPTVRQSSNRVILPAVGGAALWRWPLAALGRLIKMSWARPSSAFATQGVGVGTLGRVPPTVPALGGFTFACYGQLRVE